MLWTNTGIAVLIFVIRSRTWTLSLLTLVVVLLFADQNLLAPNLSAVAEEFGFDGVFWCLGFAVGFLASFGDYAEQVDS